jgi:nicotinamidase-related amidase
LASSGTEKIVLQNPVLLTIDLQNDFALPGLGCVAGTMECVPQVRRLTHAFGQSGFPVVHVIRLYEPDGSNAEPFRRPFLQTKGSLVAPGTNGSRLVDGICQADSYEIESASLYDRNIQRIGENEWLIYKPRWDAFFDTSLEDNLRSWGVQTVVVCGCNLPNCPRATLFGASARDFNTVLAYDAVSQTTPERLSDLSLIGTRLLSSEQIIEAIRPQ